VTRRYKGKGPVSVDISTPTIYTPTIKTRTTTSETGQVKETEGQCKWKREGKPAENKNGNRNLTQVFTCFTFRGARQICRLAHRGWSTFTCDAFTSNMCYQRRRQIHFPGSGVCFHPNPMPIPITIHIPPPLTNAYSSVKCSSGVAGGDVVYNSAVRLCALRYN